MQVTENELLAELIAALPPLFDPCKHVTWRMLAEVTGMGEESARSYLKRMAKEMKLKMVQVRFENGQIGTAYEKAEI